MSNFLLVLQFIKILVIWNVTRKYILLFSIIVLLMCAAKDTFVLLSEPGHDA